METKSGYSRLAERLDSRSREMINDNVDAGIEIGEITADLALKIPRFGTAIPQGQYALARHLTVDDVTVTMETETAGEHSHDVTGYYNGHSITGTASSAGGHKHKINITRPQGLERLKPGERVIVVWDGAHPVVVDVVVNSAQLTK